MTWTKKCFLHNFLIIFVLLSSILLISTLFASILFWNAESVKYCLPFFSNCLHSNLTEKKFNETDKYEATKEEETPYFIWEQCLNTDLDPCEDFYDYSCSKYSRKYETQEYDNGYHYVYLTELAKDKINKCFLDTFNSDKSNSSTAVQKMRQYQREYERTKGVNEEISVQKLVEEIKSFGSCPALSLKNEWKNNGVINTLLNMTNLTGLSYLYEIDSADFGKNGIQLVSLPSKLIFSNPSYLLKTTPLYYKSWSRRNAEDNMRDFFRQIFELIVEKVKEIDEEKLNYVDEGSGSGEDDYYENYYENEFYAKNYTKIAQELVNLELKFIHIYNKWSYFTTDDNTYYYYYLSQAEYKAIFGIANIEKYLFNNTRISTYFNKYLYGNGYHIGDSGFYMPQEFLADLSKFYRGLDDGVLANYLCLRFVLDRMPYLNENFKQLALKFESDFKGEIHQLLPKYNEDTKEHIESMFPLLSDHLFVTHCQSSPNQIEKAKEIVKNVLNSSIELIENADWLDDASKENAMKKLKSTIISVGTSEIAFNETKLDEIYEKLDFKEADGIMEMERKLQLFNLHHNLSILHAYDNYADFEVLKNRASEMNARAGQKYAYIFIALGYLFPPNFDVDQPNSNGYANIGATAGHEFFHLLDSTRVNFFFDGSSQSIFSDPETEGDFGDRTSCLQRQYSRQKDSSGLNLDGAKTLDEDIADDVAVRVAYHAYLEHLKREGGDRKVPGYSNYTNEQSFFINYAMHHCSSISSLTRRWKINNQQHSLPKYRVNLSLRNFHEFSKAFNCSVGSQMNPRKKCRTWKKKK